MALHIVKLCVGVPSPEALRENIRAALGAKPRSGASVFHVTRTTPARAAEIVGKGSLYWVMKGRISARQAIVGIEPFVDHAGTGRCRLVLSPEVVDVETSPRKMFQGWRYLEDADIPRDMSGEAGAAIATMPDAMRRELAGLGLL